MQSTQSEEICPDWLFLNNANVNIAKDRGWFTTYTPFESSLFDLLTGSTSRVLGIGTVHLPVRQSPSSNKSVIWELKDVLHAPDAVCNVFGMVNFIEEKLTATFGGGTGPDNGSICNDDRTKTAYFLPGHSLYLLAIEAPQGKRLGPPVIVGNNNAWAVTCRWNESEKARWEEFKQAQNRRLSSKEYSEAEMRFLKKHWENEFKFLLQHGLSIHKKEDREEGRAILRAFMDNDG